MMITKPTPYLFLTLMCLSIASCRQSANGLHPLVEVNGKLLYSVDVEHAIPFGINKSDSMQIAQKYVKEWATNVLLYQKALENIKDSRAIDSMVEAYRRSLIINQYEQQMLQERVQSPSNAELTTAYQNNGQKLKADRDMVEGVYIKVPINAPYLDDLRAWMRRGDTKSMDAIYKYSKKYATQYQYFGNEWVNLSDIARYMPLGSANAENSWEKNKTIEVHDRSHWYLVHVFNLLPAGSILPFELAKESLRNLLIVKKETEFLQHLREELYTTGIQQGKIIYHEPLGAKNSKNFPK